jgi:protein ImuB
MVSVWLPLLSLERLKRESKGEPFPVDRPLALVGSEERGLGLTAVNAAAMGGGLSPSMGLADARAICPHLLTEPSDLEKDSESLVALARWASRYSPSVNVDGRDGLWLDITGVPHLFGGARLLLADVAMRFGRLGFSARLALAETLGGAHALARFARSSPTIVPAGQLREALAPLPVEALRLAETTTGLLRRLGLKRIGQLCDLPRASLERRFHSREAADAVLHRLDQALGIREEPRAPLLPWPDYVARLSFPEPLITHEGVVAGLDHLAVTLCHALAQARLGVHRVVLRLYRTDGSCGELQAAFSAPAREPTNLLRILQDRGDSIDVGFGVDLMVLAALSTEPLLPAQTAFAKTEEKGPTEPLIDRLVNRLSGSAVRRLFPRQSHVPERAQKMRSAFAGASTWAEQVAPKPPRPFLLLAEPEPLNVLAEVPEGPPTRFTWRRITRRVVKAEGPERIAPEWWRKFLSRAPAANSITSTLAGEVGAKRREGGKPHTQNSLLTFPNPPPQEGRGRPRDYYRIEDEDGHRYWVFREGLYQESASGTPCWYLHGVFG